MRILLRVGAARKLGIDIGKLRDFVHEVSLGYRENPYHNWQHAVEVAHTAAWLATRPRLQDLLLPREVFWLLVAAIVHDIDHPGHGNHLEVAAGSALAVRYKNQSVLENHALDQAFALIHAHDFRDVEREARNGRWTECDLLRELVIATDRAGDIAFLSTLADAVNRFCGPGCEDREAFVLLLLKALLKIADVGAPTLPFVQAAHWAEKVTQELKAEARVARVLGLRLTAGKGGSLESHRAHDGCIDSSSLGLLRLINLIEPATRELTAALLRNAALFRTPPGPNGDRLEPARWSHGLVVGPTDQLRP